MTMQMEEMTSLEIRLLGPCTTCCQGAPLRPLRTRKGQWLLALLALVTLVAKTVLESRIRTGVRADEAAEAETLG